MVKVENQDTLRLLASRFMKMNRGRNLAVILAASLTTLMITSLFGGSASLVLSRRATEIKQSMSSSHATIQDITQEEMERSVQAVSGNNTIKKYGTGTFLGPVSDKRIAFSTELRAGDSNLMESFNTYPSTGTIPSKENEAAVSTLVLDALGIPHKTGETITINWTADDKTGRTRTDQFTVCGFWEGDKAVLAQIVWVSENYARKYAQQPSREDLENGLFSGGHDIAVWYKNTWDLEKKTKELSKAAGFTNGRKEFQANPAFEIFGEDGFPLVTVIIILLLVMLSGYLIIYNIFSLSVKTDIWVYGLLKNAGTTGRQLVKIVRMQVARLSVIGIPAGIVAGMAATRIMAPSLVADTEITASSANTKEIVVTANPVLLLLAAAFSLATVYISSMQACHIVKKVSPVEALGLAENSQKEMHQITRKYTLASWQGMALQNVIRDFKKGVIVMLSIALSLVVVNWIVMLINGYDFASYQKIFLEFDFQMDQLPANGNFANFNGINQDIQKLLDNCPYSETPGYVYYSPEEHNMEPHLIETMKNCARKYSTSWERAKKRAWKEIKKSNQMPVHFIGISENIFSRLDWRGEPCTWEEFKNGDCVITDYGNMYTEYPFSYYQKGGTIHMQYKSGTSKDYKIAGEALMPYSLDYPYYDAMFIMVLVPETEFIAVTGNNSAMYAAFDAKPGMDRQARQYIDENITSKWGLLNVFSVLDMKDGFERYLNKYYMIGGALVLILGTTGIINFFNTVSVSVTSRKRELALLEATGMTKKQLKNMLVLEGLVYLLGAFLLAVIIVLSTSEKILYSTLGGTFYFQMHLTIMPCIAMIPVLLVIAYIVPWFQWKKMGRESIIERIESRNMRQPV